jgi:cyclic lactone autoinducer peptide
MFSAILSFFGFKAAAVGSQACVLFLLDEPKCPKSLIK